MQLNLKSFSQLVADMGAALQGSASSLIDVSVGSVIRAVFEANASVVLWMQWLVLQVLSMTRAATSIGIDLDTWMADFGLTRLGATPATGAVTFSRYTNTLPALVPAGAVIKTSDGSLSFSVTADPTLSTWQQSSFGYVLPTGVSSTDVPASCLTAGSVGNVLAGTLTVIASSLPGIDQVTNANSFSNGLDAETDQALRTRFQSYLASLSGATLIAVKAAISDVQQGLVFVIEENVTATGLPNMGSFVIVLDDGSGYPRASLLSSVATAVNAVRPIGTMFSVVPPTVLTVDVSLTIFVTIPADNTNYTLLVQASIADYLNSLPIQNIASITRLAQSVYSASGAIYNVANIALNGGAVDITPPAQTVVKAGSISVLVNGG